MKVSDILREKGDRVIAVRASTPLSTALKVLSGASIGALVVEDERGAVLGLFSEREAVIALARRGAYGLKRPVSEIIVRPVLSVAPAEPVLRAMTMMTEQRARHLLVLDTGRVVGVLSLGDVVKSRLTEKVQENLVLQDMARWPRAA